MSEKIASALSEVFIQLQEELAEGELKQIIKATPQEITDEGEGLYQYEIPFKRDEGRLVFEYEDGEYYGQSSYNFYIIKYTPLHVGYACLDFAESYDDGDLPVDQFSYEDDEERGEISVAMFFEGSWKKQGEKKFAKMKDLILEAWEFCKEAAKYVKKNENVAIKEYGQANKFLKDTIDLAASKDSDILPADSDSYFSSEDNDIFQLALYLSADVKPHMPDLTLRYSRDDLLALSKAPRYAMNQDKFKILAKIFLEDDEDIGLYSVDGRGEDATYTFFAQFPDVDIDSVAEPAKLIDGLYIKTKQFSQLIKDKPNLSIGDLRPLPEEAGIFENFSHNLYLELAAGAINGLNPLPMHTEKAAWGKDEATIEMTIPLAGNVFLLGLTCFHQSGHVRMALYIYRYGLSLKEAREVWDNINDEDMVWIAGKGKKELAWLSVQKNMDELNDGNESMTGVDALARLDPRKCFKELRKFYSEAVKLGRTLKSCGKIDASESETAIDQLRLELSVGALADENSSGFAAGETPVMPLPGVGLASLRVQEENGTPAVNETSEQELVVEAKTDVDAPNMPEGGRPEDTAPTQDAQAFSEADLQEFMASAAVIFNILKADGILAPMLPGEIPEATEEGGIAVLRIPLASSPLMLRFRYDPSEKMLDAGWSGNVGDGLVARCRREGKRFKEKNGVEFSLNEDTGVFIAFREEKTGIKIAELDSPAPFAHKLAALYEPTLKFFQKIIG